ncbi:cell division protein FtsL [Massilia sp. PAMC28688]|uniref:cell division protein FtsL n=1 Tax=Massilia sp. PAMC28688 TaxID=2861283 RepID=UPI001C6252CC|nr:cell division protein FtsL [Massilia sp. PAMC28688]QYF94383.1 cell division protein FtsL [Massilia sp. PAMC28688]
MSGKINVVLTVLLVGCALSLVKSQYEARNLFIEKGKLDQQASQLEIDWDQLRLDYSTLSKNSRIEQIARTDLNMVPLTPERTQYLTEGEK